MKTEVKKISHKGLTSVVEWYDAVGYVHRTYIPSWLIQEESNGKFFVEDVEEGHPYGVAWELLVSENFDGKKVANILRRKNIWTLEDYANNSGAVTSAFNEVCTENVQQFREAVLDYLKRT